MAFALDESLGEVFPLFPDTEGVLVNGGRVKLSTGVDVEEVLVKGGREKLSVELLGFTFPKYFCATGFAVCKGLTLVSTVSFFVDSLT